MSESDKYLNQIDLYATFALLFLLPIFVLPIFPNAFLTAKLGLLVVGVLSILVIKALKSLSSGTLKINIGSFDLPLLILAGTYLASAILRSPNFMEAFFLPGTATIFIAGFLLYLIVNQLNATDRVKIEIVLFSSAVAASLIVLLATAGVLQGLKDVSPIFQSVNFTTFGDTLFTAIYLAALLPIGFYRLSKTKDSAMKAFWGVSLAIVIFGAVISVINTLPSGGGPLQLTDFKTSWVVAIDSLKESPILGIGSGNYITAFNLYRPIEYNQTDFWQLRFSSARSFYLTIITETGLLGLAGLAMTIYVASKFFQKNKKELKLVGWSTTTNISFVSLLIVAGSMLIFPAEISIIALVFVLLALNSERHSFSLIDTGSSSKLPMLIANLPVFIIVIFVGYQGMNTLSAEVKYKQALDAIAVNDGAQAYEMLRQTIETNPRVDRYRASYAQVNLALANSIASNPDVTDQDRATITQLIQQAIREGKATVALNETRANNWEILANIYQAIIPLAQGSDTFAAQSYSQAIALDPLNPNTRIALGGIYYAAGNYDTATRVFELAVAVKPDNPNAHFNLAYTLRENEKIDAAIQEMAYVLSIVDRESNDYEVARNALEEFESLQKEAQAQSGDSLTPPQDLPPVIEPPIELPEDSAPPPTPTPQPTDEAEPTPLP